MAEVSAHSGQPWGLGRGGLAGRDDAPPVAVPVARAPQTTPSPAAAALGRLDAVWHRFDDLEWADPCAHRADHVLVGPGGVFVIDAKAWPGTLEIGPDTIRHRRRRRHEALTSVASAAKAIGLLLEPLTAAPVYPMLCFDRDVQIRGTVGSVHVSSTANLLVRLAGYPVVLDAMQSRRVADSLLQAITPYETAVDAGDAPILASQEYAPRKAGRRHWILHRP